MIVVSFERELREAFAAGKAAGMAPWIAQREGGAKLVESWPKTYEEWIASIRDRPAVARG